MNVPFLPWQVWDPSVPLAALEKHSRFDSHEHVFLYHVEMGDSDSSSDGEAVVSGSSDGDDQPENPVASPSTSRSPATSSREDSSLTAEGIRSHTEGNSEMGRPRVAATGRRGRKPTNATSAVPTGAKANDDAEVDQALEQENTAATRPRRRRKKRARADLWEKRSADELPTVLMTRVSGDRKQQCNGIQGEFTGTAGTSGSGEGAAPCGLGCATPSSPVPTDKVYTSPVPLLSEALWFHRDRERFIVLHTSVFGDAGGAVPMGLPSPLETVRATLRRVGKRPFTGKSFRPGDVVAYFGGCIRPLRDVRCRPEHSPLAIPMIYFTPTALRESLCWCEDDTQSEEGKLRRMCAKHRRQPSSDQHAPQQEECSHGVSRILDDDASEACPACEAARAVDDGLRDLLVRLSQLSLIVTNDMMFCPVLAKAAYSCSTKPGASSSSQSGPGRVEVPLWHEEADALLKACNVALVLTLDSLGSPHVAAVATKQISSFEPLLARLP